MSESERESIPQQLRAARRDKGVELEDAHRKTGVSLPVLQGLEAGKYDVVEPVFARMAFGAYVDYLGLDKEALLAQFDALRGMGLRSVRVAEPAVAAAPEPESGPAFDGSAVRMVGLAAGALVVLLLIISFLDSDDAPAVAERPARAAVEVPIAKKEVPVAKKNAAPVAEAASAQARSTSAEPERKPVQTSAQSMPEIPTALEEVDAGVMETESPAQGASAVAVVAQGERGAIAAPSANSAAETPVVERAAASSAAETPVVERAAASRPAPSDESVALTNAPTVADEMVVEPNGVVVEMAANALQQPGDSAATALDEGRTTETELVATASEAAPAESVVAAVAVPAGIESGLLLLEVEAVDSTWVQVNWDESGYFQGIVPRGESRRWQAKNFFRVHSGRAHGLRYTFQGELLGDGALGEATRVLRFLATAEGVNLLGPDLKPLETAAQP
jgi:cytoskeletal protein RodZ